MSAADSFNGVLPPSHTAYTARIWGEVYGSDYLEEVEPVSIGQET